MKKKIGLLVFIILAAAASYWYFKKIDAHSAQENPFTKYAAEIPATYRIGFTNLDQELTLHNIPAIGTIPSWISGTLLRNGPAKFYTDRSWVSNWFDGLAMIHAFTIEHGSVRYSNKFLKTSDYEHVKKTGLMNYAGFMQDPCGSFFKNVITSFFPKEKPAPNANVNIATYSKRFIALTEIPLPIEFDPETLETLGVYAYNDKLPTSDMHDTAHPHYDPVAKQHLGFFTHFGQHSTLNLFSIADGGTTRTLIASRETKQPSYMHSFSITENYAILTALPLVVNPLDVLKGRGFIENFKWKPELGTQLIVINRQTGAIIGSYKTKPFFAFHTVNAFEEDNLIHLDIVTYPNALGLAQANFDSLLAPDDAKKEYRQIIEPDAEAKESGQLERFTIDLATHQVTSRFLSEQFIELPRINYENFNGRDYTYLYAFAQNKHDEHAYVANKLVKINVKNGALLTWQEKNCYPGEPVFIQNPHATSEDDGVIASIVLDATRAQSFLLLLDAKTFQEIARAYVPHHIPFGIHGIFASKDIILA